MTSLRWTTFACSAGLHLLAGFVIVSLARLSTPPTTYAAHPVAAAPRGDSTHRLHRPRPESGRRWWRRWWQPPGRTEESVTPRRSGRRDHAARRETCFHGRWRIATSPVLSGVLLDAKPLASGSGITLVCRWAASRWDVGQERDRVVASAKATGPGSAQDGPGIGPGSGGGIGGGVYRAGGAVAAPRVVTDVKPTYTNEALFHKIQGTAVLELVVKANGPARGHPGRSLAGSRSTGSERAIVAVAQWRFEPGRLAGRPVDVLVTVMIDFWIR